MKKITTSFLFIISHMVIAQTDYTSFEGEKASFIHFTEYKFANIYDYSVDANTGDSLIIEQYGVDIPEEFLTEKYSIELSKNIDNVVFSIVLKSRLIIDINNVRHVFIKYKIKNDKLGKYQVIDLIESNGWIENNNKTEETLTISKALEMSSVELFYLFYNQRGDDSLINSLKPQVKGESGTIDIYKYLSVIKANKTKLANYLDE